MTTKPVVELVFRRDVFGLPQFIKVCVYVAFNVKPIFKKSNNFGGLQVIPLFLFYNDL